MSEGGQPLRYATAYRELPAMSGLRHAWGLWGTGDFHGCLNKAAPEHVLAASRLVRRGAVFPLDWDMGLPDPPLFERPRLQHELARSKNSTAMNDVISNWNTQCSSQWDGFRHVTWAEHGHYNGDVPHGMHHWAQRGIVGRSVLADVGRWRAANGRRLLFDRPDPISADDLKRTLSHQGVRVEPGDFLLIRTGWIAWYMTTGAEARATMAHRELLVSPGLSPAEETAELLWDLQVAAVAADNPALEVWPQGCEAGENQDGTKGPWPRRHEITLHTRLLAGLGLPIGELWFLEALASDCADDGEFCGLLTSAPINLRGAAASPANALVIK